MLLDDFIEGCIDRVGISDVAVVGGDFRKTGPESGRAYKKEEKKEKEKEITSVKRISHGWI